jgi:uncharacterized membrane protein YbhN (UPF0104 family)
VSTTLSIGTPAAGHWSGSGAFVQRRKLLLAQLLTAWVAAAAAVNRDLVADSAPKLSSLWERMAVVTVPAAICLSVVSVLHYVAAAVAARAASGVPLPGGELVATQLAASAANRLTPSGLGGATLTGRYFIRRGRLEPSQAAAAVSALALLGAVADVLAFSAVVGLGTLAGFAGARNEVPLLVSKVVGLVHVPTGWSRWAAISVVVLVGAVTWLLRKRTGAIVHRGLSALRAYRVSLLALLMHPVRMATLMAASASTTLLLAAGFATAATLGPTAVPPSGFCALMIGYMAAAAAGNALPTPGGIGTVDAALTGGERTRHRAGVPVAHLLDPRHHRPVRARTSAASRRAVISWSRGEGGAISGTRETTQKPD